MMELQITTMAEWAARGESPEYLFWVGCAGSFDDRHKKVTRAMCEILTKAELKDRDFMPPLFQYTEK